MRVLIADDDDLMRMLLVSVAAACGHEIVEAGDGAEALARYRAERPPLVVLDWEMPRADGLEVCRAIRADADVDPPFIVVITARDATEDLERVLDAGADDYVTKPVTPEQLRARLRIAERRIENDRARRAAEAALARAQWLAGIGETTLAIQHEINNPLAALLGNAALLRANLVAERERAECLTVMVEEAERIAAVVRRLGAAVREPRSVEYMDGARMLDLNPERDRGSGIGER